MYPKLRYIDALRGWAILLILMSHVSQLGNCQFHWLIECFFQFGDKGVQLFFVISSFTLFASYNYRLETREGNVRDYYIRRFFRIAPMYYLAFVYYFWQKSILCGINYSGSSLLAGVTFLNGFSPYWINGLVPGTHTIVVEMMFYALLPLLVLKIRNINQAFWFTLVSYVVAVVVRYILRLHSPIEDEVVWRSFLYLNLVNQLPSFGIGIIAYYLVIKKDTSLYLINYLIIILLLIGSRIWDFLIPNSYFYSVGFLFMIYLLSKNEFKFFVNRFTVFVGKISYSVFYIHFAISFLIIKTGWVLLFPSAICFSFVVRYLVILAFTLPLAWLAYQYIETPGRNLGNKIIARLNAKKSMK